MCSKYTVDRREEGCYVNEQHVGVVNLTGSSFRLRAALCILLLEFRLVSSEVDHCDFDCMHPRRPETEELFNRIGHHERSASLKETMDKLNVSSDNRHQLGSS